MKNFYVLAAILYCSSINVSAQTLFSYGSKKVEKAEFLQAFNKNNSGTLANNMSAADYLELYTNFKLKVQAARDLRMDTLPNLLQDAKVFKEQILDSYLTDEAGIKALLKEAFIRSQEDIHVLHYSFRDTTNGSVLAENMAKNLKSERLLFAGETYPGSAVADVGYLTVFSVPYVYENLIYNTAVGANSAAILRNKRWHIFKVVARRSAVGQWKAAQILLAFPQGINADEELAIKQKADSVYSLVQKGMPFEKAAELFSNDRITNLTGGLMPTFGTGRYSNSFEDQVFSLKKDEEISKPFKTEFGYHIVKRISVIPVVKDENDFNNQYELRQKVSGDSRMVMAKDNYALEIVKKTGWAVTNTSLKQSMITKGDNLTLAEEKLVLGKFKVGKSVTGLDWKNYFSTYWKTHENDGSISNTILFSDFEKQIAADNYVSNIESYNSSFAQQMKEFVEGNLLFEVMEKKVWSKAGNDEAALKKYYEANAKKYIWAASADAIVVNCSSKEVAEQTMAVMKGGKSIALIIEDSKGSIFTDGSRFELDQLVEKNAALPQVGSFSPAITNSENGGSFVYFKKIYPAGEQKSYDASRGQVINDYQEILEKEWIAQLKKTYPVKYNTIEVNKLK